MILWCENMYSIYTYICMYVCMYVCMSTLHYSAKMEEGLRFRVLLSAWNAQLPILATSQSGNMVGHASPSQSIRALLLLSRYTTNKLDCCLPRPTQRNVTLRHLQHFTTCDFRNIKRKTPPTPSKPILYQISPWLAVQSAP